ncbi:hypothetical protein COW36_21090 [bacterium (Candidatus Blackallbacteria) CG17_big_fil_post_rev_8_21_14_2_50_48_46]|uniref:Peptidylprolyl isomerase n=1 Tax=bacterium (Candidatus Blackallbacteria) CG17_big_fil_post_rev_8_21_14_2_50_48_46 TaxID=2014261 RepID=A0A2M7FZ06_9BACT|nr:MAG: hypothetical protein COW64_14400 [bacterium (Candidatus Blackallbacteria) CG18_big_fil_WC_8_21_14_2_50_49_26]PIW14538.1 MAG: hypothetical protein COW36_21090 [bacterium (Candidatus Blackallbacteria) CG17_big_fil_post_rev_8_21_14_2_50_48_46]PIW47223.1 MAG: hypothetical protein COW20_13535 [bacterium (Candidatus Blackallbacteria) CG13_big_fil_rev_8_21_14_2_50_49_14]
MSKNLAIHSTFVQFILNCLEKTSVHWVKIIFLVFQLGFISDAYAFETFYRNQDFQMTRESQDLFYRQIKPILDMRCVSCHSCREAECRLKLTSPEGLIRGGHTQQIHGGDLFSVQRTQLFHDAKSEEAWREKGFYSVLNTPPQIKLSLQGSQPTDHLGRNSILTAALLNRYTPQEKLNSINLIGTEHQYCGKGRESFDDVPGMPYKMSPLNPLEFTTLYNWAHSVDSLALPSAETLLKLKTPKNPKLINRWEQFFNHPSAKARWTSRFLYEHLFLARFYFEESPGEFYELVRSKTAYPAPIEVTPTLHAYEAPEFKNFYYRLRKVHSTIVDKNHFVYEVNDSTLQELKDLFWNLDWGSENNQVKFNFNNSNPLVAFKHIPASSRYLWMLKNAHLLLDISARSQNCRSEGAAAPYWDNMLHVFIKPEADASVVYGKKFYDEAGQYLPIPNLTGGKINPFSNFIQEQREYAAVKQKYSQKLHPKGLRSEDIWLGDKNQDPNAIVTVLRHQWTASTVKGAAGKLPRSVMMLDFALFERYFYLCNVATEVSEAMISQSRVVTYLFDVRKEGENIFLSFIPKKYRNKIRASLVEGLDPNDQYVNAFSYPYNQENGYRFEKATSYQDFMAEFLRQTFKPEVLGKKSFVFKALGPVRENEVKTKLEKLSEVRGGMGTQMPNVSYLRITQADGTNIYYTITANRYYKSRNQLGFIDPNYEKSQRSPERDSLEIFEGIFVNFPEKIYLIQASELDTFTKDLQTLANREQFLAFNQKYGLDQNAENFWPILDEINATHIRTNPIHGGIIDLHRYGSLDQKLPL